MSIARLDPFGGRCPLPIKAPTLSPPCIHELSLQGFRKMLAQSAARLLAGGSPLAGGAASKAAAAAARPGLLARLAPFSTCRVASKIKVGELGGSAGRGRCIQGSLSRGKCPRQPQEAQVPLPRVCALQQRARQIQEQHRPQAWPSHATGPQAGFPCRVSGLNRSGRACRPPLPAPAACTTSLTPALHMHSFRLP